ncbi:MAG: hypothetical protein CVV23_14920 [Ignavibacteriae bacterium HGW-Ignavibacteriae-2]|jgi:SAM-dependent methyltransferase|nr:class I SAM-dependent methyltransferase [Bacteroidota bacterium]PKL87537.1 MAG: hypothetical protein CVV23_14920 [Ignavibacteriae bacterium HGW-Ignavibacteriae-2]
MTAKQYKYLAQVYDHLMRKIDYNGWAEYIYDISDYYKLDLHKSLEIAAGNCKLAKNILRFTDQIIVSDFSKEMLIQNNDREILKVCCDMKMLPFRSNFNTVFCTFDSVNYLMSKEELLQFFTAVENILDPGGIFTFDASLELNSINNVKYLNRHGKYNGIKYRQVSDFDSNEMIHTNTFFLELPEGNTISEIHRQKVFEFENYFEVIDDTNMYVSNCFDFFTFDNADRKSERVQFVLRKYD